MAVRDVVQAAAGQGGDKLYVEDVFSTYLHDGNTSTQVIPNGVDLENNGGLVWIKRRSGAATHALIDSSRGLDKLLTTASAGAQTTSGTAITSFNSDGFTLGANAVVNATGSTNVSWTFRKAPKFFDVVTWTGDGSTYRDITTGFSNCGAIIAKCTSESGEWWMWHRTFGSDTYLKLNRNVASSSADSPLFGGTGETFGVAIQGANSLNTTGATYVAYVFAHDAGGFGDDGLQNVISCGSYVGNTSTDGPEVDLGYEPQWILVKKATGLSANWYLYDTMRGWTIEVVGNIALYPNLTNTEINDNFGRPTATGFKILTSAATLNETGQSYIYIAIRRGPMKTPESGTEVFAIDYQGTGGVVPGYKAPFPVDMGIWRDRDAVANTQITSRLTNDTLMYTNLTSAEASSTSYSFDYQNGFMDISSTDTTRVGWMFRRAPGFFDVLAYTGDGTAGRTVAHNLGVAPEMIIVKQRDATRDWYIGHSGFNVDGDSLPWTDVKINFNSLAPIDLVNAWNDTAPDATNFTVGNGTAVNGIGSNYISYLFSTLAGVSKVGSYSGTGTTQTINCGFSSGARFVLIKRTDTTGDWYVWDSTRGIVAGNDPYLLLNSTAAEVTSTDYIDPVASGFEISSSAPAAINASGGSYIFLAIA